MQCPQCQHENAIDAKFCDDCGSPFAGTCSGCRTENRPGARFCKECGASFRVSISALSPFQPTQPQPNTESQFHAMLPMVIAWLQGQKRLTYRTLKDAFRIDDTLLNAIRKELGLRQLAMDEDGEVLVWAVESQSTVQPTMPIPSQPATAAPMTVVSSPTAPTLSSPVTETRTPSNGPTVPTEAISIDAPHDKPAVTEPIHSAPEAERRQLTVMFCDLADSTKLSQQLDPEDLREVVRAYQQTAADMVQQYEGHIAQYLGDGLLIYFGWPVAHEDDAQRAVHAGLGIVEAIITTLNPRLAHDKDVQLTVRLGVHTGPVVVGAMGGGSRQEHLATGETVNIAARLEGVAHANTIVVSRVTARLLREAFALEDLGSHALKGVAEPMPLFRVLGTRPDHGDETGAVGMPFLVGRDEEVGLLLRRWEQSKAGLGQVVLISGEAGIGKSSLVAMMRHRAVEEGATRLTFRCSPYHANSVLYPVIEHVQRVLQFHPGDAPTTKLDKLEGVLSTYSRPLEEVVPLYAALLSVPMPGERYAALNMTPQQQRHQTQEALVGWLLEEAERHPTLALWEDLHWADTSTLELLGLILEQTPTVPMLHVLTSRPEFEPPWLTRSHLTPVTLNRLERPQVEAMVTHLAGGKALPAEVVEHVVVKTDGMPLYVEELTKMLLESEVLREEVDRYELTASLPTVTIPGTLHDSLMARLDRLRTAKEVAQLGAVLGREFPYAMLQAIASQDEELLQAGLGQLVDAELLYQRGRLPRATYIFKHALIQDVAYASLLKSTRQQYHQQIAQVLAAQFPETVEAQPELLAHHFTQADLFGQAVEYWQRAGERASASSAYVEAVAHLRKGLDVLQRLPTSTERARRELTLQLALAESLSVVEGYSTPVLEPIYQRAREVSKQLDETPQLVSTLQLMRRYYMMRLDLETARELGVELLDLAPRQHDAGALQEGHWGLGQTLYYLGDMSGSRTHLEQSIAAYVPQSLTSQAGRGLAGTQVAGLVTLGRPVWALGYPDQARTYTRRGLSLAQELAHPFTQAFAHYAAALNHFFCRDVHGVLEQIEASLALGREHDFPVWIAWGTFLQGWALAMQGRIDEGLSQIHDVLITHQEMIDESARLPGLVMLAEVCVLADRVREGLQVLGELLALVEKTGGRFWEAEIYRLKGLLLLTPNASQQKFAEAEPCFHKALNVARHQQAQSWELRAATSLARLWQSQDKRQEAYDLLAPVYGWFTEGFDTVDLQEARALLEELSGS